MPVSMPLSPTASSTAEQQSSSAEKHRIVMHGSTRDEATHFAIGVAGGFLVFGFCYLCYRGIRYSGFTKDAIWTAFLHSVYCFSGVALTLGQQSLAGHGLVYAQTGLLVLPSYLGASLAFPLLFGRPTKVPFHKGFVAIAACDLVANVFGMTSLVLAGPQVNPIAVPLLRPACSALRSCLSPCCPPLHHGRLPPPYPAES